jgi:hypothetical protein
MGAAPVWKKAVGRNVGLVYREGSGIVAGGGRDGVAQDEDGNCPGSLEVERLRLIE